MLRFALNSLESVIRPSIYISIISSDMQNLNYGFCGTFLKSAFGAKNPIFSGASRPISPLKTANFLALRAKVLAGFYLLKFSLKKFWSGVPFRGVLFLTGWYRISP